MIGATETAEEDKEPDPVVLNSVEFFIQALSYFEGEASGQLSSREQSPASSVASSKPSIEINAINEFKTALIQDSDRK